MCSSARRALIWSPAARKTVERCTYTVKNHPSGKVCQADLYICGGEIVAGDISAPAKAASLRRWPFRRTPERLPSPLRSRFPAELLHRSKKKDSLSAVFLLSHSGISPCTR
ncbi:MAG: DUF4830 domain-containing protein [Oscillospiraceae bacterium]